MNFFSYPMLLAVNPFSISSGDYMHLDGVESLPYIVLGVVVGLVLGAVFSVLLSAQSARLLSHLLSSDAVSPEKATTLPLDGFMGKILRFFLRSPSCALYRYMRASEADTRCAEDYCMSRRERKKKGLEKAPRISYTITPASTFYIPEDKKLSAEAHASFDKAGYIHIVYIMVGGAMLCFALLLLLPTLLGWIDGMLG